MKTAQIFILSFLISVATVCSYAQNNNKTLVLVSANWCHFCKVAKTDIEKNSELSEAVKKYEIIEIDFDADKDFVNGYNIKTIPTFIILDNKKEIKRQTGYRNPRQLLKFLN